MEEALAIEWNLEVFMDVQSEWHCIVVLIPVSKGIQVCQLEFIGVVNTQQVWVHPSCSSSSVKLHERCGKKQ